MNKALIIDSLKVNKKDRKRLKKQLKLVEFTKGNWFKLTEDYCDLKKGDIFMFDRWQVDGKFAIVNHSMYSDYDDSNGQNYYAPDIDDLIPATDEEVENALINEAKKRGFNNIEYSKKHNELGSGLNWIFRDGKWADIIEDKITIELSGDFTKHELIDILLTSFEF